MKSWMLSLSLVSMLALVGFADAKGAGGKKGSGIHGTIVSVNGTSFTMTLGGHGKKKDAAAGAAAPAPAAAPTTVTVETKDATVTGTLAPGAHVSVEGAQSGDKITASTVTISAGHHKKKAAA